MTFSYLRTSRQNLTRSLAARWQSPLGAPDEVWHYFRTGMNCNDCNMAQMDESCGWFLDADNVRYFVDSNGIEYYPGESLGTDADGARMHVVDELGVVYFALEEGVRCDLDSQFAGIDRFDAIVQPDNREQVSRDGSNPTSTKMAVVDESDVPIASREARSQARKSTKREQRKMPKKKTAGEPRIESFNDSQATFQMGSSRQNRKMRRGGSETPPPEASATGSDPAFLSADNTARKSKRTARTTHRRKNRSVSPKPSSRSLSRQRSQSSDRRPRALPCDTHSLELEDQPSTPKRSSSGHSKRSSSSSHGSMRKFRANSQSSPIKHQSPPMERLRRTKSAHAPGSTVLGEKPKRMLRGRRTRSGRMNEGNLEGVSSEVDPRKRIEELEAALAALSHESPPLQPASEAETTPAQDVAPAERPGLVVGISTRLGLTGGTISVQQSSAAAERPGLASRISTRSGLTGGAATFAQDSPADRPGLESGISTRFGQTEGKLSDQQSSSEDRPGLVSGISSRFGLVGGTNEPDDNSGKQNSSEERPRLVSGISSRFGLAGGANEPMEGEAPNGRPGASMIGWATSAMAHTASTAADATMMVGKTAATVAAGAVATTANSAAGTTMMVRKTAATVAAGAANLAVDATAGVGKTAANVAVGAATLAVDATAGVGKTAATVAAGAASLAVGATTGVGKTAASVAVGAATLAVDATADVGKTAAAVAAGAASLAVEATAGVGKLAANTANRSSEATTQRSKDASSYAAKVAPRDGDDTSGSDVDAPKKILSAVDQPSEADCRIASGKQVSLCGEHKDKTEASCPHGVNFVTAMTA